MARRAHFANLPPVDRAPASPSPRRHVAGGGGGAGEVTVPRDEWLGFGVRLDDACCVVHVDAGSSAALCGLRRGSRATAVDGVPIHRRADFAREWDRGARSGQRCATIAFAEPLTSRAATRAAPAPPAAPLLDVRPSALFLPPKALRRGKQVVNVVTLCNTSGEEVLFALRSTHPRELAVTPWEGILGPHGHATDRCQVDVTWRPAHAYDFDAPEWGPHSYPQLDPPWQPVLTIASWPRAAGVNPAAVPPHLRSECGLPVCFCRPAAGDDDFHFSVDGEQFCGAEHIQKMLGDSSVAGPVPPHGGADAEPFAMVAPMITGGLGGQDRARQESKRELFRQLDQTVQEHASLRADRERRQLELLRLQPPPELVTPRAGDAPAPDIGQQQDLILNELATEAERNAELRALQERDRLLAVARRELAQKQDERNRPRPPPDDGDGGGALMSMARRFGWLGPPDTLHDW